jgi:hypothetical protein
MSLVSAALLFLVSGMRRRATPWWSVMFAMNVTQIARLVPAVVATATWARASDWAGLIWAFLFIPFLGILAAVGLVTTLREARKGRRRRLASVA